MRDAYFILLALLLCAFCACMPKPTILVNDSAYPTGMFYDLWGQVEVTAKADINLSGFLVHVFGEDKTAFLASCPAPEEAERDLGCTDSLRYINILGSVGTNAVEVGGAVAHMLGHVHYRQSEDDPDWSHFHAEWFGPGGVVEQIEQLINDGGE